jgi:hypothetical protein
LKKGESERKKNRFLLGIVIAIIFIGILGICILWPTLFPPSQPRLGIITIKAIDQNNKELVANVTVNKGGITVTKGATPLILTLEYGTYTFIALFRNLKNQKTVEINQPTQEIIFQFTTPSTQKSLVTIRAIDQHNRTLNANVTIGEKSGVTPFSVILDYGTYTVAAVYQNLTIQKTIEVNQATQEVILQFTIPTQPVSLEITSDELLERIDTVMEKKFSGKNVTELENWLFSLKGKTIRVTGSNWRSPEANWFYRLYVAGSAAYGDIEFDRGTPARIEVWGVPSSILEVLKNKKGSLLTIEGEVTRIYLSKNPSLGGWVEIKFIKLVENH